MKQSLRLEQIIIGFLIISCVSAFPEPNSLDECKALVLSGGGALGAWETGVYYGLTHYGNEEDFHYDVMTGISAGSINTAGMVLCPKGTDKACSEWMSDLITNDLNNNAVWKNWPLGPLQGIAAEVGLVNNAPMLESLDKVISTHAKWERPGSFGSANIENGNYMVYNQTNIELDDIKYVAKASASIPGVFPYQEFRGIKHMDGGTIVGLDIPSAVHQCSPLVGGDLSKITIDVFTCNHINWIDSKEETSRDALKNFLRNWHIHRTNKSYSDITNFVKAYPEINFRYIIGIGDELSYTGLDQLNFNPGNTTPYQLQGRKDAQAALERGPGYDAELIRNNLF